MFFRQSIIINTNDQVWQWIIFHISTTLDHRFLPCKILEYRLYMTHMTQRIIISLICIETCSEIGLIELTVSSYYKSCAVVGNPRDATVNFDRYGIMFSFDTRGSWHGQAYVLKVLHAVGAYASTRWRIGLPAHPAHQGFYVALYFSQINIISFSFVGQGRGCHQFVSRFQLCHCCDLSPNWSIFHRVVQSFGWFVQAIGRITLSLNWPVDELTLIPQITREWSLLKAVVVWWLCVAVNCN